MHDPFATAAATLELKRKHDRIMIKLFQIISRTSKAKTANGKRVHHVEQSERLMNQQSSRGWPASAGGTTIMMTCSQR